MNFEQARDFSGRLEPGRYGFDDLLLLLRRDFWLSPRDAPLGARFVQAGARALADHLALEFGEGGVIAESVPKRTLERFRERWNQSEFNTLRIACL